MPGEREPSVFMVEWFSNFTAADAVGEMDNSFWQQLIAVRDAVNRELENQRNQGALKGGLDAEVTLYCDDEMAQTLGTLEDELRFVLITSAATVAPLAEAPADACLPSAGSCRRDPCSRGRACRRACCCYRTRW